MFKSKWFVVLLFAGLSLLLMACTPGIESGGSAISEPTTSGNHSFTTQPAPGVEAYPAKEIVPMTTVSAQDLLPGNTPGSDAANNVEGEAGQDLPSGSQQIDVSTWLEYQDDVYRFQIAYPPPYVTTQLSDAELNQLTPRPVAAVYFLDPRLNDAASPTAPPQFSIRVFAPEPQQPLEEWLPTVGLFDPQRGWSSQPYQGKMASGLAVFSSDFMAPGWFVYISHNGLVYQLTPLGAEAEAMLDTFSVLP